LTKEHLASEIVNLLVQANTSNSENSVVLPGAALAADLYLDDIAIDTPGIRRSILLCAVNLFEDTSNDEGVQLQSLLRVASEGDSTSARLLTEALRDISAKSTSNLATKVLRDHLSLEGPISVQAKLSLAKGRRYSKPEGREGLSRSFVLGKYVEAAAVDEPEEEPRREIEAFSAMLTSGLRYETQTIGEEDSDAGGDLPTTSLDVFRALDSSIIRGVLVQVIQTLRMREPDVAHYGTSLLRYRSNRLVRGTALQS